MPGERAFARSAQQRHHVVDVVSPGIEPALELFGSDRHGNAVMQRGEIRARRRCDDGDAVGLLAVRSHPGLCERGKSNRLAIAAVDEERPLAAAQILPFVVAICRNQTASSLDRILEGGLVANRLGTRVDQQRKTTGILHPRRNQSPAHQPEVTAAIFQNDNRNWLCRCNIIPRREVWLFHIAEYLPKCRRRRGNDEATTHYLYKLSRCLMGVNPRC